MTANIKSPLSDEAQAKTGRALQGAVVDLIDLALQAKQVHWNLTGKHFRPLHLQLDEVVASARAHTDTCAERAITIGTNPDGRPGTVGENAQAPRIDPGYISDDKAVAAFVEILAYTTQGFRQRIADTADADAVTENIFEDITADLEKHLWMFQVQR